jgi:hypothetical protein
MSADKNMEEAMGAPRGQFQQPLKIGPPGAQPLCFVPPACPQLDDGDGHGVDDPDDALTVWEYLCKAWKREGEQKEQAEDDMSLLDHLRQALQKKHQQEEDDRKQSKKKARHDADRKFWQRWKKRAAYMEELGGEAGNLLYKVEHADKRQKQREKAKKKARQKGKKRPKKQKRAHKQETQNGDGEAA